MYKEFFTLIKKSVSSDYVNFHCVTYYMNDVNKSFEGIVFKQQYLTVISPKSRSRKAFWLNCLQRGLKETDGEQKLCSFLKLRKHQGRV